MKKSGIYIIKNIVNGKIYVGSAVNFYNRFKTHKSRLNRNVHHSIILQNSINKHGIENFEFIPIQYCKKEDLIKNEQWWLDLLQPEYNIEKKAGSSLGRKATEETKRKMSLSQRNRTKSESEILKQKESGKLTGNNNKGKPRSESSKLKISLGMRYFQNKISSK